MNEDSLPLYDKNYITPDNVLNKFIAIIADVYDTLDKINGLTILTNKPDKRTLSIDDDSLPIHTTKCCYSIGNTDNLSQMNVFITSIIVQLLRKHHFKIDKNYVALARHNYNFEYIFYANRFISYGITTIIDFKCIFSVNTVSEDDIKYNITLILRNILTRKENNHNG